MNGFAKMNLKWDKANKTFKSVYYYIIMRLSDKESLCLACAIYSLSSFGAKWDEFPEVFRRNLMKSVRDVTELNDQSLSNIIYGLAILEADL